MAWLMRFFSVTYVGFKDYTRIFDKVAVTRKLRENYAEFTDHVFPGISNNFGLGGRESVVSQTHRTHSARGPVGILIYMTLS